MADLIIYVVVLFFIFWLEISWEQTEKVLLLEARCTGELQDKKPKKPKQNKKHSHSILLNGLRPEEDTAKHAAPPHSPLTPPQVLSGVFLINILLPLEAMHKDLYAELVLSHLCVLFWV